MTSAHEGNPPLQQLAFIRDEIRFEIGLLHDRVNALLAAEAFLTIAYTAAMSDGTPWGPTFSRIVSPILALLGLSLALLGVARRWRHNQDHHGLDVPRTTPLR